MFYCYTIKAIKNFLEARRAEFLIPNNPKMSKNHQNKENALMPNLGLAATPFAIRLIFSRLALTLGSINIYLKNIISLYISFSPLVEVNRNFNL